MRAAIYYAPDPSSALARRACAWLGRDAHGGPAEQATPDIEAGDLARLTAAPRRYGFHATLKAPFALSPGMSLDALSDAATAFAARRSPIALPLAIAKLGDFFALVPAKPLAEVDTLAAAIVVGFDRFRALSTPADLARRRKAGLDRREDELLARWGYPYVFDRFRFHMSLTGPVAAFEAEPVAAALERHFGDCLAAPVSLDRLAVFVEPAPGADFHIHSVHMLGSRAVEAAGTRQLEPAG